MDLRNTDPVTVATENSDLKDDSPTEPHSECVVSELLDEVTGNLPTKLSDDSLENNFGLLSAIKEVSVMVPPPPTLDWSVSNAHSLLGEIDVNKSTRESVSIHDEILESIHSSTPRNIERSRCLTTSNLLRQRTSSVPGGFVMDERGDECNDDIDEVELEKSSEEVISELKKEFDKNGETSKDIELKIDKLSKALIDKNSTTEDDDSRMDDIVKENVLREVETEIGKSNLVNLSLKNIQRKDGKMKRCGKCATCKHRCGNCLTCVGDVSKSKAGCKKRFICLKFSSLIDPPVLMRNHPKRPRENNEEETETETDCKGLKLS